MEKKWLTTKQKADEQQLSTTQIRRQAKRGLYPGASQLSKNREWRFPLSSLAASASQASSAEEIVIGEKHKQAVLKHQEDLRAVANRWKSQIWLPPPWRWDVANLRCVSYLDTKNNRMGYKLPEELVRGEESIGHGRAFLESQESVIWDVPESGATVLKASVEDEPVFGHLKLHTEKSSAWGLFTKWKTKGGDYIQLCSSLLGRIEQDVKRALRAKDELSWWSIYHDAFCNRDTQFRCARCGTLNTDAYTCPICGGTFPTGEKIQLHIRNNHPKTDTKAWLIPECRHCRTPLGWLRPFLKEYKRASGDPRSSAISIDGWTNIEESVENGHFEGVTRGHKSLRDKYRGGDLVENIFEAEREVRQVQERLVVEITYLSEQMVFLGKFPACPD